MLFRSVVRGTVPDNCVVAGVPAKVVRQHVEGIGWSRPNGPGPAVAMEADLADLAGSPPV